MTTKGRAAVAAFALLLLAWIVWIAFSVPGSPARRGHTEDLSINADDVREQAGRRSPVVSPDGTSPTVTLVVRDLWDRSAIAFLTLRASTSDKDRPKLLVKTDDQGHIELREHYVKNLLSLDSQRPGYVVASSVDDVRERREVWCYRNGRVAGRVVFEDGARDFDDVELSYSPRYMARDARALSEPGHYGWIKRSRVIPDALGSPRADGTFYVRVPRVEGAALVARTTGYFPAWATLDASFDRRPREIVLVIRRGLEIEGTLRDETGAPLAGQKVHVYVVIKTTWDEQDTVSIGRIKQGGFTVARSLKNNWVRHKLHYSSRTDETGKWSVDIGADGEVFAVAYVEGAAAIDRHLGPASRITGGVELEARPTGERRIRIEDNGSPLAQSEIKLIDLSLVDAKPSFRLKSDEDGFVHSTWFVSGKRYAIWPPRGRAVFFTYSGQSTIDIRECEQDFDKFMSNR